MNIKDMGYIDQAKELVRLDYEQQGVDLTADEVFIVWFSKTLQNWKAIAATSLRDNKLFEVTYNGDKQEAYIDRCIKESNKCVVM